MADHNELGKLGEEDGAAWLVKQGFDILHHNWYSAPYELDLIARKNEVYHFIEVKTSLSDRYGYPEERVSKSKLKKMMEGATRWLYQRGIKAETRIQYDVLSVVFDKNGEATFTLFEDVSL